MGIRVATIWLAAVSCLVGCGSEPKKPEEAPVKAKPVAAANEYETGRAAFQRMYVSARTWAPDAQLVRLESRPLKDDPKDGTAGVWVGLFVSAAKQSMRSYTWTGVGSERERGVSPGSLDYYSPANANTRPWDLNFLKVDSTKALEVANGKGGAAILKKNPELPLKFMLFFDSRKNELLWRVIYGSSVNDAKLKVLVYASSGLYFKKED